MSKHNHNERKTEDKGHQERSTGVSPPPPAKATKEEEEEKNPQRKYPTKTHKPGRCSPSFLPFNVFYSFWCSQNAARLCFLRLHKGLFLKRVRVYTHLPIYTATALTWTSLPIAPPDGLKKNVSGLLCTLFSFYIPCAFISWFVYVSVTPFCVCVSL